MIAALIILLPLIHAPPPPLPVPPLGFANVFFTVFFRPLYAWAWGEVLFWVLIPETHGQPEARPRSAIRRSMLWSGLSFLSNLSYPIYMVHFRIGMSVVFNLLHPSYGQLNTWLGAQPSFAHLAVCWVLILIISIPIAYVVHEYLEKPLWKHSEAILKALYLHSVVKAA
jgi:peptidoglycan/LPS O-acetylase OafA/YrhL